MVLVANVHPYSSFLVFVIVIAIVVIVIVYFIFVDFLELKLIYWSISFSPPPIPLPIQFCNLLPICYPSTRSSTSTFYRLIVVWHRLVTGPGANWLVAIWVRLGCQFAQNFLRRALSNPT